MSRKNEIKKKFQQNKKTRVESSNKKYNTKMSKSDQNYINGNYTKAVNQKVYGVKYQLSKGNKVNGYGDDYVDTKGMKRSRYLAKQNGENPYEVEFLYQPGTPKKYVEGGTRADGSKYDGFYSQSRRLKSHEKESYKNTGTLNHKDYMPKKDYAILSSANKNAKKFKDHLNTSSWDGIKTAKENQRTGKHLSNAFEYVKGGLKDVILDPVADAIKVADYLGSTTVAGISGFAEDSGNVFKAIADPNRDLKYYTKGKSYTKENLKSNFDSLNKTGSGQSMSKYLHEARQRGFEENYNLLKEQGRHKDAEEYKKNYEKETPLATRVLNVTGFVGDLTAPSTLENIAFGVGKGLVKNTAKSFKDMVKGTADLSTGILPEETAKLMAKAQKYTGKASGSSDDVFYSGKKATSKVDKLLDNDYEKVLVRDNLKENFKTPKLTKYLEKIMSNSGKDTLYAKEIDNVKDLARDVSKNKKNVSINDLQKHNLPSSNYNVDTHVKKDPELKKYGYDKGNRYYEDYDVEFFKEVDRWQNILDKDPDNRLKNIERMKKYNKEVYDYMQQVVEDDIGVFNAEEFLNNLNKKNNVKEDIIPTDLPKAQEPIYPKEQYVGKKYNDNHYWVGPEELGNNFDESIKNINDINKTYNKFNKKVLDSKFHNTKFTKVPGKIKKGRKTLNSKTDKVSIKNIEKINDMNTEIAVEKLLNIMNKSNQKIPSNNARKFEFGKNISSITENIINGTFDTEGFKKIKDNVLNDITVNQKIEYLNSVLFGGQEVITKRANKKNIDMFVKSIDEINEASKIISHFEETGEMLPIKLSQETKDFLKIPKNKQIKVTDKKVAGKVVDNPQDIITVLANALINRSGSLTDARYIEKQQLLANKYGYKKLQYVKDEVNEIKKKLKALDKQTMTPSVLAQKQELSSRRKQLQELIDNRQYDWDNILKSMNETTFDDYIAKEHPDIMDRLEFYKKHTKESKKVSEWANPNRVKQDFKETLEETASENKNKRMTYADFVREQYAKMTLKDKALDNVKWEKELKKRWNDYKLELDGAVDDRGMELYRSEKMRNQIRDGASSIKNNNVGQNSRARQEVLNEVGEYAANKYTTQELHKMRHDKKMFDHKINNIRKTFDLPKPRVNSKVKLQKGQKFKDLPPVKENLTHLRKTIQKEIKYMFEYPERYDEFKDAFKQIKLDYVNSLRSIGVPDDKYFHKVTALQNELKDKMNKILEGGTDNTPLLKMELQKLASKVDETFNSLDDVVLDKVDDIGTEIGSTLRQSQDNTPQIKNNSRFSDESFNSFTDIQKNIVNMPIDEIKSKGNQLEDMINAMKKQGVPYEEYADLEDTLRFADKVLKLQNSGRLNIKRATFDMPKFDGSVNPFAPIKDNERLIYQVDNVTNDVNSLIPKKNTPLDNIAPYVDDMEDILGVDQYLSPDIKWRMEKDQKMQEFKDSLQGVRKDPKGKQLSFDGRTLNKKYTQLKNTPKDIVPYNTPLDEIADNGSEQVNMLEYMFNKNKPKNTPKIAPNDVIPYNKQSDALEGVSKTFEGKGNTKFNDDVIELSDDQYKIYDELLNLGYDEDFAKKTVYNITNEEEYNQWLKTMGYNTGDGFEKFNEELNMYESEEMLKKIADDKKKAKKERATIDPRTEERLKYYEENFGKIPKPKSLFDDIELPPGVDEDGVIIDATEALGKGKGQPKHMGSYFKNKHIEMLNGEYTPKEKPLDKLPYENDYIFDKYKRWLNSYKKGLTVYNPGWHFQNFFQNKGQNFLALGMDAFKPQTDAKNILKHINGEESVDKLIWNSKTNKAYTTDEMAKLAQELGVTDGLGEDVKNARGIFSSLENYIDNTPLMKSLEKNEQTARLHHFVKQIERGMSPEDAAKSVNKYLFDYSKKNKADKVISDFIDPFWTFHKNNARLMYTSGIEHSDKIAKINRATKGLEEGIPEEQLQNEGSKYGKLQRPYLNYKDSVNKDDYNYLYNQNIMPDFEDAFPFSQEDLENKLNPLLRLAMQQSRGEGNFGNKIVKGDKAGWNEITEKDRVGEIIQELNPFMPNLANTIISHKERQQKADDGKQSQEMTDRQILLDWMNYITGNKGNWYRNLDM